MNPTRRTFLQQTLGLIAMQYAGQRQGGAVSVLLPATTDGSSIERPSEVSMCFGVSASGKLLDPSSYYRVPVRASPEDRLCFDVSNNRISCSINSRGLLERFAIELGVAPIEIRNTPAGAYVEKLLYRAGPWPILIATDDHAPVRLDSLPQPEIRLHDTLFPIYSWKLDNGLLHMLLFAPQSDSERPRAVCVRFCAEMSPGAPPVRIVVPVPASSNLGTTPVTAFMTDQAGRFTELLTNAPLQIDLNHSTSMAFLVASDAADLEQERNLLGVRTGDQWLAATEEFHSGRFGSLRIPDAPFFAELYIRAAELCRQSLMLDSDANFGGSFNGSDLPAVDNVWMRDCFYSSLPQSWLYPELCAKAILFFLRWSIPSRTLGEHADKFAGASAVTNSLGNSVAGIVLAGEYYAHTGDAAYFEQYPEVRSRSLAILEEVLSSRREDVFLFPSIYVSDGESRGDFHTGSNIFLWRAFSSFARLASDVYKDTELAQAWSSNASLLREAILTNCVVSEAGRLRFVEGVMQDHTTISGHDGEESDVTLAPFYEFCDVDDAAYLNTARAAIQPDNPYAISELEGIWWYAHGKWSSATFPGWITGLGSSQTESEVLRHLERIRTLTDGDGSFWWWPYLRDAHNFAHPRRMNSKCGWAAGTYLCYFTGHLLGLSVDAPMRKIALRPFLPWHEFAWTGCCMGSIKIDCSYVSREEEVAISLRNRMSNPLEVTLQAILPDKARVHNVLVDAQESLDFERCTRYGRVAVEATRQVAPGSKLTLLAKFWS